LLEVVVDLKTDLKTIMQTATPRADDNKRGRRGRAPAIPKTTFQVQHRDEFSLNLTVSSYLLHQTLVGHAIVFLQRDVHQLARELLNLPEDPLHVPTPEDLRSYAKNDRSVIGPQIKPFVLDLASKGIASRWNKSAISIFVTEFLSRKIYLCTDPRDIKTAFTTYLTSLQGKYKKQQAGTTNEAARITELDNKKRSARYARRTYVRNLLY
jgi:hypothetical protein